MKGLNNKQVPVRKKTTSVAKVSKGVDVFEENRPTQLKKIPTKGSDAEIAEAVNNNLKVRTIDTSSFVFPNQVETIKIEKFECSCCGLSKITDDFYPSYSIVNKQRAMMTICKDCIDVLWKSYLLRYTGDLAKSLYYFCMLLDIPFFKNIMEEIKVTDQGLNFFKKYMTKILAFGKQNSVLTFLEGQLLFDGSNEKNPDFFEYDPEEVNYIPNLSDVKAWGRLTPQDIYFLKTQYEDWCSRYEVKDKGMEEVIKQICHKQLRIFRMNEQGANTSKELKDMQDLMTSGNLKPIQNKSVGTEENTLGNWIKRFENERPIPVPDPEFADVDGIWKKIRVWFLGHFSKVYNYENEYSREYEQEMSKYKVATKEDYETKWATHQMGKELFKDE